MRDLLELRDEIDQIDSQIVDLYERRMAISEEVAEYKIAVGKKVFDKQREVSKLETLSRKGTTPFLKHGIRELFEQIMSMSRKRQYQLLTEHGQTEKPDFKEVDHLDYKNAKIVFQGTEGAYSQLALNEYFGENADSYHVDTWRDAMEAIQNGEADYAVFPIENSSAGIVSENYDLMVEYNNYIVGEQVIPIEHCLLALPGTKMEEIKRVYSHPQSLMQSARYLAEHDWQQISMQNNAFAALKVAKEKDKTQAAIASEYAGETYGLEILEKGINDSDSNSTRFIIVTNQKIFRKNANKISLCLEIPHESGSLYHILSHFIYNNLNMTKIESRPIPDRNWEYRFFIDFEGNLADSAVKNALRGLREEARSMKILGNY
mgnify:CR=1 FL=1